ncbi:MAG: hypothetical protein OCD02_12660 [Spirochaetaceae bacterium]
MKKILITVLVLLLTTSCMSLLSPRGRAPRRVLRPKRRSYTISIVTQKEEFVPVILFA